MNERDFKSFIWGLRQYDLKCCIDTNNQEILIQGENEAMRERAQQVLNKQSDLAERLRKFLTNETGTPPIKEQQAKSKFSLSYFLGMCERYKAGFEYIGETSGGDLEWYCVRPELIPKFNMLLITDIELDRQVVELAKSEMKGAQISYSVDLPLCLELPSMKRCYLADKESRKRYCELCESQSHAMLPVIFKFTPQDSVLLSAGLIEPYSESEFTLKYDHEAAKIYHEKILRGEPVKLKSGAVLNIPEKKRKRKPKLIQYAKVESTPEKLKAMLEIFLSECETSGLTVRISDYGIDRPFVGVIGENEAKKRKVQREIDRNFELQALLILRGAKADENLSDRLIERACTRAANGLTDSLYLAVLGNFKDTTQAISEYGTYETWEAELKALGIE